MVLGKGICHTRIAQEKKAPTGGKRMTLLLMILSQFQLYTDR